MKKKLLLTLISCCLLMGIHAKDMSQYECFSLMKGKIKPSVAPMLKTTWGQNVHPIIYNVRWFLARMYTARQAAWPLPWRRL